MRTTLRQTETSSTSVSVRTIHSTEVDLVWDAVKDELERSMVYSPLFTMAHLYESLKSAEMQLWLLIHHHEMIGAVVTRIENYPNGRVCQIFALAGYHLRFWVDEIEKVEAWAREIGCTHVQGFLRSDLEPIFTRLGLFKSFDKTHVLVSKQL